MRLTVDLDPDVAALLEDAVRRAERSKKRVVNDALRGSLLRHASTPVPLPTEPEIVAPAEPRPYDASDHAALTEALARIFGLPAPPPVLRLVKNESCADPLPSGTPR